MVSSFGAQLRQLRLAEGWTQEVLAERAGVAERTIQALERDAARPRRETLRRLIAVLEPSPETRAELEAVTPSPRRGGADASATRQLHRARGAGAAGAHRKGQLPVLRSRLIGREQETAAVRRLLLDGDVALVTLTGPGGVGKTRLGLQIGTDLTDHFLDGVFWVPLAPISDPELVVAAIAQALGCWESGGRPLQDMVKGYLGEKRVLVLLDNFERLLPAAPHISDLLTACSNLKVLVTSRAVLRLRDEREVPVPPLACPDPKWSSPVTDLARFGAVDLFVQRATEVKGDFSLTEENGPVVAEICRRLDGLPLALELAAARIKLLSPQALLTRLERRLPLLTGGARDLPVRQQTLRDTITWSYDLLDPPEQELLCSLAVFVGGFTLEAAEAVCSPDGGGQTDVHDGVTSLVDKSLLQPVEAPDGERRFTMLETIREFALERLGGTTGEPSLRRRHLAFYVALAEEAEPRLIGPETVDWLDRLTAEHDNARAALAWSLTNPDTSIAQLGVRLAVALRDFWFHRDHLGEGRRWLERVVAVDGPRWPIGGERSRPAASLMAESQAADDADGPRPRRSQRQLRAQVAALNGLAQFAHHQGEFAQSDRYAHEALELARSAGDPVGAAHALTGLGNSARIYGELTRAISLHTESLALFREAGDLAGALRPLLNLGSTVSATGDYDRAQRLLEEVLTAARALASPQGIAWALWLLGRMAYLQRSLDRASNLLEESILWWQRAGATRGPHWSLGLLGTIAVAQDNPDRATAYFLESLRLSRDAGDRIGVAQCLAGLASVSATGVQDGRRESTLRAVRLFGASWALCGSTGARVSGLDRDNRPPHDRVMAAARAQFGDEVVAEAWAEGQAMPLERAIALALDGARPDPGRVGKTRLRIVPGPP